MKILLCGERSFAASGLYEKLTAAKFDVDCFSRGIEERIENKITGDVFLCRKIGIYQILMTLLSILF
jgi:hypothetical protein